MKFNIFEKTAANMLVFFVRLYKATFSFWLGGKCRFVPSCSEYAIIAINKFGPLKGFIMSIWRIIRCNPFSKGGYDYPEK